MTRRSLAAAIAATAALASTATAAQAHVTLQPKQAPAGGFARLDVRVPNEDDAKATTKVVVQMPPGFADASYEPVPGWRVAVAKRKLATPVKTDEGDTLTEEVDKLTFTATGKGIAPGQFQDFGLSVGLPDKPAGTKLTFKALQTYAGGNVVRWIGAPGSEHPAPQVTLVAADEPAGVAGVAPAAAPDEKDDDGDGNGLAIVALIVGGLGLLAGAAALVRARG
jgi:periplasmic copper chaperone A